MSKVASVHFRLQTVELIESCINQQKEKPSADFQFDINVEIKFREAEQFLIAICQVNVFDQQTSDLLGSVKTAVVFFIENWNEFYDAKKKTLTMPNDANVTFNSLAISTTRGIMFSLFRGTVLHNAFLPIVDPTTFVFEK